MQTNLLALRCTVIIFIFFFESETRQLNVCINAETFLGDEQQKLGIKHEPEIELSPIQMIFSINRFSSSYNSFQPNTLPMSRIRFNSSFMNTATFWLAICEKKTENSTKVSLH